MLNFIIRKWAKWRYLLTLGHDAVKAEMDAAFVESGIPDMEKLVAQVGDEIVPLQKEFDALEGEHEYAKRQERKSVADKINERRVTAEKFRSAITSLKANAQMSRSRAAEMRIRSEFIKNNF